MVVAATHHHPYHECKVVCGVLCGWWVVVVTVFKGTHHPSNTKHHPPPKKMVGGGWLSCCMVAPTAHPICTPRGWLMVVGGWWVVGGEWWVVGGGWRWRWVVAHTTHPSPHPRAMHDGWRYVVVMIYRGTHRPIHHHTPPSTTPAIATHNHWVLDE